MIPESIQSDSPITPDLVVRPDTPVDRSSPEPSQPQSRRLPEIEGLSALQVPDRPKSRASSHSPQVMPGDGLGALVMNAAQLVNATARGNAIAPREQLRTQLTGPLSRIARYTPLSLQPKSVKLGSLAVTSTVEMRGDQFVSKNAFLRALLQCLAKQEEVGSVEPEDRLSASLRRNHPTDLTFTVDDHEIHTKHEQLQAAGNRQQVELHQSKHDRTLVREDVEGNHAINALYDTLEKGPAGFGKHAVIKASDAEQGGDTSLYEHQATTRLRVSSTIDPGFAAMVEDRLNSHESYALRAKLTASMLLYFERKKEIPLKGPAISLLVDLACNLPYELVGAPAWKRTFFGGVLPGRLSTPNKIYAAFTEALPTLAIEIADTYASLFTASELGRKEFKPFKAFLTSLASGHIALGTAFIAAGLRYAAPESEQLKVVVGIATVLAGGLQMLGGISGYMIEPRSIQAGNEALEVHGMREEFFAVPQTGDMRKYVEQRAERKMDKSPDTNAMQQTVMLGLMFSMLLAALGPNAGNKIPERALIPLDVAIDQPFESIGAILISLLSMAGIACSMKWMSSEKQKLEQRMTRVCEREMSPDPSARNLTAKDNDDIDKAYLATVGRQFVALAAKPFQAAIYAMDALHIRQDNRVRSRLPLELIQSAPDRRHEIADRELRQLTEQPFDEIAHTLLQNLVPAAPAEESSSHARIEAWSDEDDATLAVPEPVLSLGQPRVRQ